MKRTVFFLILISCVAGLWAAGSTEGSTPSGGGSEPMAIEAMRGTGNAIIPELADNPILQGLNKALNIDLTLTGVATDYEQQVNVRLASGNPPDVFWAPSRAYFVQYAKDGVLLDLTEYESRYQDFLALNANAAPMGIVDGRRYGLPANLGIKYPTFWIRKDWFDTLGLKAPETLDEFVAAAKAITEGDPDGNGKDDTYGFTGVGVQSWDAIFSAFGVGSPHTIWEDGGVVKLFVEDSRTRDALAWIQDFIATGTVDPNIMTISKTTDVVQKMAQGMVGMVYLEWPSMMKPEFASQRDAVDPKNEWIQLPGLLGPTGTVLNGSHPTLGAGSYRVIPAAIESDQARVNKVIELVNYCATEPGYRLTSYGVEGEHYVVENGRIVGLQKLFDEGGYFWAFQFGGRSEVEYLMTKFAYAADEVSFAGEAPSIHTLQLAVDMPDGYNHADAERYIDEEILKFMYGRRPLSEYDAFLSTLRNRFQYQKYEDAAIQQLMALGIGKGM